MLEGLMQGESLFIVVQVIGQERQRELSRTATAVTALESSGAVVPKVQPWVQGLTIDCYVESSILFTNTDVDFHSLLSGRPPEKQAALDLTVSSPERGQPSFAVKNRELPPFCSLPGGGKASQSESYFNSFRSSSEDNRSGWIP